MELFQATESAVAPVAPGPVQRVAAQADPSQEDRAETSERGVEADDPVISATRKSSGASSRGGSSPGAVFGQHP